METLKDTLNRIGREVFVLCIYPELSVHFDVAREDLARKYPKFATYTITSQNTRLSKAKKIFREHKEVEALRLILESNKLDEETHAKAKKYYLDAIRNKA